MKITHATRTHVGNVRSENQDAVYARPERDIYMVADGMGGEKAGAEASAQVVQTVKRITETRFDRGAPKDPGEMDALLRECLIQAGRDVFQVSVREPEKTGLGSTGSLLCLMRGVYFIAQVGDSRVYRMRDGLIELLTRDHTMVWSLYEGGVITRDQIETHPERHLLTQCIGGASEPTVDTYQGKAAVGDTFLICSDGLTGYAHENEVFRILNEESPDLETCAERLVQAALVSGGGDNVSVVLARIEALDPQDDWEPDPEALKPKPAPAPRPAPVAPTPAPSPRNKLLIGAGALLALLFVVFALRPRGIEVRLAIEHVEEPALAAIGVATVGGDLVPDALVSTADGLVTLRLPRKGEYDLSIAAPGILDYRDRVNFEGDRAEPYRIQTDPSARLRLEIEEMERLVRLEITQPASEGELKVVYAWSRSDSSAPARLDHNLVPGVRHRVEAVYESGEPRGYSTMAMVGKVETVQIRP